MTQESYTDYEGEAMRYTAVAAVVAGQIVQIPDGRAAQILADVSAGQLVGAAVIGILKSVAKTLSQVWIDGAPLWWDASTNKATCVPVFSGYGFYLGTAVGDALSADTTGGVNLNVTPKYVVDLLGPTGGGGGGGDTAIVLTAGTPSVNNRGGMLELAFTTTNEAQKVDWLSRRSFPLASKWILEGMFNIKTAPDNAAVDIDIGVAFGTHATDFESITEFVAVHLDGNDNNIDVHSDDNTTDIAPIDSTIDWATGTPVHIAIDGRSTTTPLVYINGALVAGATTLTLAAAAGPLKAIVHMEKTADDSPGVLQVDMLRVRIASE